MIIAELQGKISSKLEKMEDVLTSNVFSFFKYSDRTFLKNYFRHLDLFVTQSEAEEAKFMFWPRYSDNTEPDLVIICGNYYILFEAKLYSDFSPKTQTLASQIDRELTMGIQEALNLSKEFVYVAITAEYYEDKSKYKAYQSLRYFKWTNWAAVASFLFDAIEKNELNNNQLYVKDLYELLLKKKQRSFIGLNQISNAVILSTPDHIFYDSGTSDFKGEYSGIHEILTTFDTIPEYSSFFSRSFFNIKTEYEIIERENVYYDTNN